MSPALAIQDLGSSVSGFAGYKKPLRQGRDKWWIGVDLDGTLAEWHADTEEEAAIAIDSIGEPIRRMVELVEYWLEEGWDVRIFTARVAHEYLGAPPVQSLLIKKWCLENIGRILPITNSKDPNCVGIYDDKAVQVPVNLGYLTPLEQVLPR